MLKELLKQNVVEVTFIKRDGSERHMRCTLQDELIGIRTYSKRKEPDDMVTVWDLEKQAWRSFRTDSILSYRQV
jgi:hypothetical protein